jgi:hypothetical protein
MIMANPPEIRYTVSMKQTGKNLVPLVASLFLAALLLIPPALGAKLDPQNTEIQPQRRRRRKRDEILGCFLGFLCGLKHLFRTAAFFGP